MKEHFMEVHQLDRKKGMIALISVLILAAAVSAVTIALLFISTENFVRSRDHADTLQANALAESCAEYAINFLFLDENYAGNEVLTFGSDSCTIRPVIVDTNTWTIETEAIYGDSVKRYEIILDTLAPSINILQYEEVVSF